MSQHLGRLLPLGCSAACLGFLLLTGVGGVEAQAIEGRLLDEETGAAVDGATVALLNMEGRRVRVTLSDSAGVFSLEAPVTGRYRLRAERLGYQQTTSPPVDVRERETVEVELRISVEAIPLAPLTVVSERPALVLDPYLARNGYYERKKHYDALGAHFLDWRELRERHPWSVTSVVRMLPGIRVYYTGGRGVTIATRRGQPVSVCLDGVGIAVLTPHGPTLDELAPLSQVVAMEVYPGMVHGDLRYGCTLLLWTGIPPDDSATRR